MLTSRPNKSTTLALAHEAMADAAVLAELLHLLHEGPHPVCWHAAWVIEKVAQQQPELLTGERARLAKQAIHPDTPDGLRRLLLTTLHHLPDAAEIDVEFFNFLLDKMTDLQSPPAVQAISMKLAERMSRTEPDLHDELLCIIRNLELDYYPPALRSVARRYAKKKRNEGLT